MEGTASGSTPRRAQKTSGSSTSSGSVTGSENLPSIRNLLSSIEGEEQASSPSPSKRAPSSPVLSAPSDLTTYQAARATPSSARAQAFTHSMRGPHRDQQGINTWRASQSWDLRASLRPSSPTRRPPLAPSAYAHAHFSPSLNRAGMYIGGGAQGDELRTHSGSPTRQPMIFAPERLLHGTQFADQASDAGSSMRQLPPISPSRHQHEHSRSLPSMQDSQRGTDTQRHEEEGTTHMASVMSASSSDETGREQKDSAQDTTSSSRRRHTLGALDEPPSLRQVHDREHIGNDSQDVATTPRAPHHQNINSSIHRGPESPTTPTAGHAALRGAHHELHRSHARSGSNVELPPHPRQLYMQSSMQISGSMPSLHSHSQSLSCDRSRKHSLEERREAENVMQPWTSYQTRGPHTGSETLTSPHSSVWHSRSSTLDSIDTSSSLTSLRSGMGGGSNGTARRKGMHTHSLSHSHSLSGGPPGRASFEDLPRTPTHARHDYNRNWRFPMNQDRTRHESLQSLSSSNVAGIPPGGTGAMIHTSPFANMSLTSPSQARHHQYLQQQPGQQMPYDSPYSRPRAQTMGYVDRPIAPLPSHSMHGQMGGNASMMHPSRSLSSHSVSSLPQRVSSLHLEGWQRQNAVHPQLPFFDPPPGSVGRPPSNTVIISGKTAGIGNAGSNKYTCTWCGKRFSRPSSLKIHYHSHTGEKPYTCDEPGCGRNFSVQSNLRRHQKSHAPGGADVGPRSAGSSSQGHGDRMSGAGAGESRRHGAPGSPWEAAASTTRHGTSFFGSRERKPSISSSIAGEGDEEEDEEEYELEEEEAAHGVGNLKSRRFGSDYEEEEGEGNEHPEADSDEAMQDIRLDRDQAASDTSRPHTTSDMQHRFEGMLNPNTAR